MHIHILPPPRIISSLFLTGMFHINCPVSELDYQILQFLNVLVLLSKDKMSSLLFFSVYLLQWSRFDQRQRSVLLHDIVQGVHKRRCCHRLAHQTLENSKMNSQGFPASFLIHCCDKNIQCSFVFFKYFLLCCILMLSSFISNIVVV